MDWHEALAAATIASLVIGACVEIFYRPARMHHLESVREELRDELSALRVQVAVLEERTK